MYQYDSIRLAKDTIKIQWKYDFPTLEIPKRVLTFLERNNINTYKDLFKVLKLENRIDYSPDIYKFLEYCTRGGL